MSDVESIIYTLCGSSGDIFVLSFVSTRLSEEGSNQLSAQKTAEVLGISMSEIARLTGLARNTLASGNSRKIDQALSPIVRVLAYATEMTGGEDRAVLWFKHQPIPGWAGKTAYDLVEEGKSEKVLNYLEAVRSGVYA